MKKKSIRDFYLFLEAWIILSISKLMIIFFTFKKIAARIGMPQFETDFEVKSGQTIDEVHIALFRGIKYVFFSSTCYDQALAVTFMLKRRKISSTIYFGLSNVDEKLAAHAWVRSGNLIVSGRKGHEQFTPVAWFGTQC